MNAVTTQSLNLRLATDADAEAISALINAAFQVERFFKLDDRTNPAEIREYMQTGRFLLAHEGSRLIACVFLEPQGERCYLGLLSVDPGRQRSGLGGRMMQAAEDAARSLGARQMDIRVVNLRTELPPIYRRLGFTETGTEPWLANKPTSQPCHFICMSKPL